VGNKRGGFLWVQHHPLFEEDPWSGHSPARDLSLWQPPIHQFLLRPVQKRHIAARRKIDSSRKHPLRGHKTSSGLLPDTSLAPATTPWPESPAQADPTATPSRTPTGEFTYIHPTENGTIWAGTSGLFRIANDSVVGTRFPPTCRVHFLARYLNSPCRQIRN
jgi:hypothetical protein